VVAAPKFTEEDRRAIAHAVAEAERRTSGEIVPVVAAASDPYERAEDLVGLFTACLALTVTWLLGQRLVPASDWEQEHELALQLPVLLLVVVVGFWLGALLARSWPALKRLALSRRVARARALIAAHHAFDALHVGRTACATGVVLYVSLLERQVCVWADRGVATKVAEAEWARACTLLTESLRRGMPREGFVAAIAQVGNVLAEHCPRQPHDRNELNNQLHVLG
jgi:putative membrane protein